MTVTDTSCLLCNGKAGLIHASYPGYQEPDTFGIYHCPECNTAFSLPRTDPTGIYNNIYRNAERVPGYNRYMLYAEIIDKVKDPLKFLAGSSEPYWGVREALAQLDPGRASILEIGSGMGYLTYSLVRSGYDARGIDISETAVNRARDRFGDYYTRMDASDLAGENGKQYDVVIATEVIEHIPDPVKFIDSVFSLLKPGGQAIITTPNKSLYPAGTIWASDLPPVHVWWFSEDSMRYLAGRYGSSVSFINYKEYYRNNYKVIKTGKGLPSPFLNSRGELLSASAKKRNSLKMKLIAATSDSPVMHTVSGSLRRNIKKLAGKLRELTGSNLIVCSERGSILCAIMKKPY